jgi:hypothetical protein
MRSEGRSCRPGQGVGSPGSVSKALPLILPRRVEIAGGVDVRVAEARLQGQHHERRGHRDRAELDAEQQGADAEDVVGGGGDVGPDPDRDVEEHRR